MRKNFYSPTAIAVTLLLAAGALALAGERDIRQSQSTPTPAVETAGTDSGAELEAKAAARSLVLAAKRAEDSQVAISYLNQVFGLDLPDTAKTLQMAHFMMADLLIDAPEAAERHRKLAIEYRDTRRAALRAGIDLGVEDATPGQVNATRAATALRLARLATTQRDAMIWLQRALELPADNPQARELLYAAHIAMAGAVDAPAKRAHHLSQASQFVKNPAERARLAAEIEALGGTPVIAGPGSPKAALTPGLADNCFEGTAVPTFTTTGEFYTDNLSILVPGDRDWYTVTVDTGVPTVGVTMRIETISDNPGDITEDDTRIWLYTDCDGGDGEGVNLIEFDDDSGEGFMSRIDSGCLSNATYYLKVNGWEEISTADNITLEIETTSECTVVAPDAFEPDDNRAEAAELVLGTTQPKSIAPEGNEDWNWFDLGDARRVRIATSGPDVDTALELFYASTNVPIAGLCNSTGDPNIGAGVSRAITNGCNSDADCTNNINPIPNEPDCLPWDFFQPANRQINPDDNVLAVSDVGGASELILCLPTTMRPNASESVEQDPADPFHWFVRTAPFRQDVKYNYDMTLEDLGPCDFESADNGDITTPTVMSPARRSGGIFDHSAFPGTGDSDYFAFDIPGLGNYGVIVNSETPGADSYLELWVGPDADGQYTLIDEDDNSGVGRLSRIDRALGPAADQIPNPVPETRYVANVTAVAVGPNFLYELVIEVAIGQVTETTDFEDCDSELSAQLLGPSVVDAGIDFDCDYDGLRFTLFEDRAMRLITTGADPGGDTVIQLVECGTENILACDEDSNATTDCASNYCSQIDGCLPGGRDYCVRVRSFSGNPFDYQLDVIDEGACSAQSPPVLNSDGIGMCRSDGLGRDDFNTVACSSDYQYSECPGGVVEPTMCEDDGAFPECDLPCPNPGDECKPLDSGDGCFCDPILLVTMESMEATQTDEGVVISWTTATEIDTVGFMVLREDLGSREKAGLLEDISGLIQASGTQAQGATYSFVDTQRRGAKSVRYYIRDIDSSNRATDHGPIVFVPSRVRVAGN